MTESVYSLSKVKTLSNGAFESFIMRDGKRVGSAENSGRGGCHLYSFINPAERELFTTRAKEVCGADEFEVEDVYLNRLLAYSDVNKVRFGVVSVESVENFHETGRYVVIGNKNYTKDVIAASVASKTPDRLLWSKTAYDFVPASQF